MEFDPGYQRPPYAALVADYPDDTVYPADSFRVEWGPIFHRGRLDGTARVLIIGQDPAAHEAICRRILVGEAGQRTQALLARLGITRSYLLINALLYSVYGQSGGTRHVNDPGIAAYRHRWLDAIAGDNALEAIISLGELADRSYQAWKTTPTGAANTAAYATVRHPTYPESASRSGGITKAEAMQRLTTSWNQALDALHPVITPDQPTPLQHFGPVITKTDTTAIPNRDLPPGLPAWMRSLDAWAARTGPDAQTKRATITVTIPRTARTWPTIDPKGG
jgi:hypothetical protein